MFNQNTQVLTQENESEISPTKDRPFCLHLNVLIEHICVNYKLRQKDIQFAPRQ